MGVKGGLVGLVLWGFVACATASPMPGGSQTVLSAAERSSLAAVRPDHVGLERFWRRDGVAVGTIKWSQKDSKVVSAAPSDLLQALRDEAGRLNQAERVGENVWLTVSVYSWSTPMFTSTPRACVEVVGRDRAGQVVWMGQGKVIADARYADGLADSAAEIVAKEIVRRLRGELHLAE